MGLSHSPKVISDGLVLYLDATNPRSYSGTGSTWTDLSGYGYNSTLVSSPTYINNKYGQLAFNGSTQYATVPYTSTLWNGQTFTLSVWAKKIGTGDQGTRGIMISKDINYIDHAYNGKTMVSFRNNTGQQTLIYGNNPASYNEWRHYAFTYDGTIGILYENGAATGSTALSGNVVNSSSNPLNIGRWDGGTHYFNGCISGAMVYNRALNADEVLQNYNATKYKYILKENIVTSGLALHYDMSDYRSNPFTGTSITDLSGIGNTGTLTNGPAFSSSNGGVISFDGTNDYIHIGSLGSFYSQGTISFWMNSLDVTTNPRNPFSTNYNGSINFDVLRFEQAESPGSLKCWFGDSSNNIASLVYSNILVNTWYCVVVTWNQSATTVSGYLNGVLDVTNSSWIRWPSSFVNVGVGLGYNNRYFSGNVAQVQIYNRALSSQEVLQNYNATKTRFGIS